VASSFGDGNDKGYAERLDPDGELRQMAEFFASPLGKFLARAAGVDAEEGERLLAQYGTLTSEPDRIAAALAPLGWILFDDSPLNDYGRAATLVEEDKLDEAEELLVHVWNDQDFMLNRVVPRVQGLYWGDEERDAIGKHRRRLLLEAMRHHRAGEFGGSITLVLSQMDGIFIDMTGQSGRDYFFKPNNPNLLDEDSLAGHSLGLRALSELMSRQVQMTVATGELVRHGILHGRELAFDTDVNSTKAWVGLLALANGVKKRADQLGREAEQARERRHAGSKEVNEWGQQLDRRGFAEAKTFLLELSGLQLGFRRRSGRYAATDDDLDPTGVLLRDRDFELRARDDGQEYWAWKGTPTGMVFGIAARDGEWPVWQYQGEEPPAGGIDSGADWRHTATDPALPDW
jgi:hypothetical protein